MKKLLFSIVALSMILGAGTVPVDAAGGRVPIYEVPIDSPGSYYLSRDLTGSSGSALITIASDDVTLDLAGHTIRRTDAGGDVIASSGNRTNIEILNGRIDGLSVVDAGGRGIAVGWAHLGVIQNNVVHNATLDGIVVEYSGGVTVADNNSSRNGGDGIDILSSTGMRVDRNHASFNGDYGIYFTGRLEAPRSPSRFT